MPEIKKAPPSKIAAARNGQVQRNQRVKSQEQVSLLGSACKRSQRSFSKSGSEL